MLMNPIVEQVEAVLRTAQDNNGVAPIVQAGDPVLRRPAAAYTGQLSDEQLFGLLEVMRATMHAAPGVGLAAPQIGIGVRIAVIEDRVRLPEDQARERERTPLPFMPLINPSWHPLSNERAAFFEGCLSVRGYQAVTTRFAHVRLRSEDPDGNAHSRDFRGWPARIIQHELDHLDGTLYLDRADIRSLTADDNRDLTQGDPATAARMLGFSLPPHTPQENS